MLDGRLPYSIWLVGYLRLLVFLSWVAKVADPARMLEIIKVAIKLRTRGNFATHTAAAPELQLLSIRIVLTFRADLDFAYPVCVIFS